MTPEEAVRQRLLAIAAVTALVVNRVSLDKLPQGVKYPAVRVQLVGEVTAYHLRGECGLKQARVQTDSYARETSGADPYAAVAALAAAIHGPGDGTGLSGWRGRIGDLEVTGCLRVDRVRDYDAEEQTLLRMRQDYRVTFREIS